MPFRFVKRRLTDLWHFIPPFYLPLFNARKGSILLLPHLNHGCVGKYFASSSRLDTNGYNLPLESNNDRATLGVDESGLLYPHRAWLGPTDNFHSSPTFVWEADHHESFRTEPTTRTLEWARPAGIDFIPFSGDFVETPTPLAERTTYWPSRVWPMMMMMTTGGERSIWRIPLFIVSTSRAVITFVSLRGKASSIICWNVTQIVLGLGYDLWL